MRSYFGRTVFHGQPMKTWLATVSSAVFFAMFPSCPNGLPRRGRSRRGENL
jgi:hypothetical protein